MDPFFYSRDPHTSLREVYLITLPGVVHAGSLTWLNEVAVIDYTCALHAIKTLKCLLLKHGGKTKANWSHIIYNLAVFHPQIPTWPGSGNLS